MKAYFALALIVLMAGCIGGGDGLTTPTNSQDTETDNSPRTHQGEELSVYLSELPIDISKGATKYFKIVAEADEDVESVKVLVYNLGNYLESSCEGSNTLRDVVAGNYKEASCSIKVVDEPIEEINQDILYEAVYKVSKYVGQVSFKVYDDDEFERVDPSYGDKDVDLVVGTLTVSPENVKEGEDIEISLNLDEELAQGDNCACSIEKVLVKIPQGFSVSGFTGWTRYVCGSFNCYERRNLDTPLTNGATVSIAGVTKTNTFYVEVEVQGVWKVTRGSDTITVLSGN
ncbi:MAG: hypothetical protein GOV01_01980 [Candidatus Altiarchaeota archaeon]|nr:hypothetical protein [Candidatus Altiarchaeota archaeon]